MSGDDFLRVNKSLIHALRSTENNQRKNGKVIFTFQGKVILHARLWKKAEIPYPPKNKPVYSELHSTKIPYFICHLYSEKQCTGDEDVMYKW